MLTIKRNYETYFISDSDNDENELSFLKTKSTKSNNSSPKIINISDSDDLDDEDELPSLETVLKNITEFTGYKKINNVEFIEIQDNATVANNNNDDFTYTINNDHFLRISKKTIQSKLKGMVKKLKSKRAISYIAKICKHKESYKYYNDFKSLSKRQLQDPLTIDRLVPGYYGMKGFTLMYEHLMKNTAVWEPNLGTNINKEEFMREVIIPELGVMFIMTDLKVHDYNTAVKITQCIRVLDAYGVDRFGTHRSNSVKWIEELISIVGSCVGLESEVDTLDWLGKRGVEKVQKLRRSEKIDVGLVLVVEVYP
ncbi:17765_t:CDS:2 [Gigaspora margarita]|uniref:17765_t:CDS:1 n=1 Tax=Gigaspora margarita TaxID=4874 RepID=A0ABM8VZA2_GIGMA|nr:17765_t:CDS:2 [Gigaspora margarita]